MKIVKVDAIVKKAYEKAVLAQKSAYAPYSNFHVGAAVKVRGVDKIYAGCNLENASIGATICAERGAIQTSVCENGKIDIEFIVVVTNTDPAIGPCGLCLQVISEFAKPETPIYLANKKDIQKKVLFKDLLGSPFSKIPDQVE